MDMLKCFLKQNKYYAQPVKMTPTMIYVHSTGANNPNLKRYVQPSEDDPNREMLLEKIGINKNGNSWNSFTPGGRNVAVHAFIGKLDDGAVEAVQTLPWDYKGCHTGNSKTNKCAIGFECCEDKLNDAAYAKAVYNKAIELCAYLCTEFNLDPLKDIYGHGEANKIWKGSNHVDPLHWWPKFGLTMDNFRLQVKQKMEDDNMTGEEIYKKLMDYARSLPVSDWARESAEKGIESGIFTDADGDGLVDNPRAFMTRQELAAVLNRLGFLDK